MVPCFSATTLCTDALCPRNILYALTLVVESPDSAVSTCIQKKKETTSVNRNIYVWLYNIIIIHVDLKQSQCPVFRGGCYSNTFCTWIINITKCKEVMYERGIGISWYANNNTLGINKSNRGDCPGVAF